MEDNNQIQYGKWLMNRYKKQLICGIIFLILILIAIYVIFAFTTLLPAGINLHRSDWLAFVGGVLALFGNIVVSTISITQASYLNEMEQRRQIQQRNLDVERRNEERAIEIKPELVVVIKGKNMRIPGLDIFPSEQLYEPMNLKELYDSHKEEIHPSKEKAIFQKIENVNRIEESPTDNIWISVVNIGRYPVKHIEVYGEYYFPFIRPGECREVILTLDHYPKEHIDRLNDSDSRVKIIDVRKELIDSWNAHMDEPKQYDVIWIDFEDIDGNEYQQHFYNHPSEVGNYYCNGECVLTGSKYSKNNCSC